MTRATYRFREYTLRPDDAPDAAPPAFTMRCAVCGAAGPASGGPEEGAARAVRHLKARPDHLAYRETITRPYRFEPEAWR